MPVAATQPTGKRSKRGRLNEGRPTKRTPELTAKIAESISFGLTDQEACAIAGITPFTLSIWRRNPEFVDALRKATAIRLQNRLKTIESRVDNWRSISWLVERQYYSRFAKPEVQIAVNNSLNVTQNNLSITISEKEVREIEDAAVIERKNVREMFAKYRTGTVDYNDGHGHGEKQRILDVEAEVEADKPTETKPKINASNFTSKIASDTASEANLEANPDEVTRESIRQKFAQYKAEQPTVQSPIVRKGGDEQKEIFWDLFVSGDSQRLVERATALFVVKEIVRESVGPRFAQPASFGPNSITVEEVLAEIRRLSEPWGWKVLTRKAGFTASP